MELGDKMFLMDIALGGVYFLLVVLIYTHFSSFFGFILLTDEEFERLPTRIVSNFDYESAFWVLLYVNLAVVLSWAWRHRISLVRSAVAAFFRVVINLYFKNVDFVGSHHIPVDGPLILTGNHANQFVDGLMLVISTPRLVRFMMAEKSLQRPMIGTFGRILGCISVSRPQDKVFVGAGTITLSEDGIAKGTGTKFAAECKPGDEIWVLDTKGTKVGKFRVSEVLSNEEIIPMIDDMPRDEDGNLPAWATQVQGVDVKYKVMPKMDHSYMFASVSRVLGKGGCIGIFPEGGSHDRTELLPLKAGVGIMAFTALEQNRGLDKITILPVGLNYFRGHKFRSRCVVEFGAPLEVTRDMFAKYQQDRRLAVDQLLHRVEKGMRAVTVNLPDYSSLCLVQTMRHLYQPRNMELTLEQKLTLTQHLADAYKKLGNDDRMQQFKSDVAVYQKLLKRHGLDSRAHPSRSYYGIRLFFYIIYIAVTASLALIPGVLLNMPPGAIAFYLSRKERERALKGSSVKVKALDVMSSYKILVGFVFVPLWYAIFSTLVYVYAPMKSSAKIWLILSLPLWSYLGVLTTEQGIVTSRRVKPLFLRLLPSARKEQDVIAKKRHQLAVQLRVMVEQYGPSFDWFKDRVIKPEDLRRYSSEEVTHTDSEYSESSWDDSMPTAK
eukprot:GFYU01002028.1.p1 GENE.GFYU01002028.1~~GFYU01002028.1.p1  ORF type:complete len:664 (+),score=139.92 GFYU01002028.1:140-2131(+)